MRTSGIKVLMVAEVGGSGGIGRYCVDVADMLREQVALACLCLEREDDRHDSWLARQARERDLELHNVVMPARGWHRGRRGLLRLWEELDRPVLHVNGRRGNFLAMTGRVFNPHMRYVTTVHGVLGLHARRNLAYRMVDMAATRGASAVISVSADTTRRLITMGVPGRQIRHITNGLPTGEITRLREMSQNRGAAGGPLEIGFLGRLSREKGLRDFVRLAEVLSARDASGADALPQARFSILGGGEVSPDLGEQARPLVEGGRLRFLGEVDDVGSHLARLDLLVMPSHNEGLPYALLEAMAAGLAVVAYGVGGIPEVIADRSLGRLVRPRDFEALLAAVEELMAHRSMIQKIGEAAARLVADRYRLESRAERLLDVYRLAAETSSTGGAR